MYNNWKALCSDETQQIVYACSYDGGIYKSFDGGESFEFIYKLDDNIDITLINYFNISCDKTGNYFICGCTKSYIICSSNGGVDIKYKKITNSPEYNFKEVHTNPDASTIVINGGDAAIFICAVGQLILYIYDIDIDIKPYFQENIGYRIGSLCLTNAYIIILGKDDATITTYNFPQYKNVGIGFSITSITGLNYSGRYIICNENYVCYLGKIEPNTFKIWVMKITDLSKKIEIPSSETNTCLTISKSDCVYENTYPILGNLIILKYYGLLFDDINYSVEKIYDTTENPTMTIIYTNPYNDVNPDTPQPLLIANDNGGIYYSSYIDNILNFFESNISCFLENTKIKILKNNEAYDELIQNLKLEDDVIISNGETRKLKFIGYNFVGVNNIKNIAKIKKDAFGLNKPCQDLYVITGHSLLFKEIPDNIKNEYYDETIYNTTVYDDYKKIIVLHTNIYETPTLEELNVINYKIKYFHIALENENKDEHYAIYSNNILTETMTLNYANKSNLIPLLKN